MTTLPDCMMPDGAEPCKGYSELRAEIEQMRKALDRICGICLGGGAQISKIHDIARRAVLEEK